MKMVLAPVDFSDVTPRVVDEAAKLAQVVGGYVVLLHVVQPPSAAARYAAETASDLVAKRAAEEAAEQQLERIKQGLRQQGLVAHSLRLTGDPKRDIVAEAKKVAADYVVMGSHGHSAFHDLVVGSTTSAVIKRSHCVVVVVPALSKPRSTHRREPTSATAAKRTRGLARQGHASP